MLITGLCIGIVLLLGVLLVYHLDNTELRRDNAAMRRAAVVAERDRQESAAAMERANTVLDETIGCLTRENVRLAGLVKTGHGDRESAEILADEVCRIVDAYRADQTAVYQTGDDQ